MTTHAPELTRASRTLRPILLKLLSVALLIGFAALVVRNAWLSDDAYITFRTVDNFVSGYGLTWNVVERVQAYTHPLWMFVIAGAYAVTREVYFTSLAISILMSLAAVVLVVRLAPRASLLPSLAVAVFCLSKAFIDYSTSGLENPLTHLILAAFLLTYVRRERSARSIFWLSFWTALGMVNRLDAALLFGPALAWAWFETRGWRSLGAAVLGLLPLVTWEAFALFYYGSVMPNTALAKLNTGLILHSELVREGIHYLYNSLRVDPITLVSIVVGVVIPLSSGEWRKLPLAAGVVLYALYVVRVGGDFMSGRLLTAPLLLAVGLIVSAERPRLGHRVWPAKLPLLMVLSVVGLTAPYTPLRAPGGQRADEDPGVWVLGRTIKDERASYYQNTGLLEALRSDGPFPNHDWAVLGRGARQKEPHVAVKGSVGFYGFFAGPEVAIVDLLALSDPLLARLPVVDPEWQIGHYGRVLPDGYIDTLATGENHIADPNLAAYYDSLLTITRGDLWDPARWGEIWRMNAGAYGHLIDAYAYREVEAFVQDVVITNPSDKAYVYAYLWNVGPGDVYLLDDASSRGRTYAVRWTISSSGVSFEGDYLRQISVIETLADTELVSVGVIFSADSSLTAYEMHERRYWFRSDPATSVLTVVYPGQEWYNGSAPGGFWEKSELAPVMSLVP